MRILQGVPIYSAGKVVELDTKTHKADLIASFRAPGDLSVRSGLEDSVRDRRTIVPSGLNGMPSPTRNQLWWHSKKPMVLLST